MRVLLFSRFERIWHWTQAVIIIGLMATGLEVHSTFHWLGYKQAVQLHNILAWTLIGLWAFVLFWHITTGQWRQYLPTRQGVWPMLRYYSYCIFYGGSKPYHQTKDKKHNPLQRLAYLGLTILISPVILISGVFYLFYSSWVNTFLGEWMTLGGVAFVHMAGAFAMLVFFIVHVYLGVFGGKPWYSLFKSMITGYEEG